LSDAGGAKTRALRPGDIVEVRSAHEILATLNGDAALDGMPFMPEMLRFVGQRFTVSRRVDKICDTISYTGSRRMQSAVYLDDLRCDGLGHDGCQERCKLYWKDAWLRRVDEPAVDNRIKDLKDLEHLAKTGTRTVRELDGTPAEVWRCQATDALKASTPLKTSDLRQYWRELTNGNYKPHHFFWLLARAFVLETAGRLGFVRQHSVRGDGRSHASRQKLNLRPGDLVEVRSPREIAETLDERGLDRGLSFDREMLAFCGRKLRVKDRVTRIIDDKTGRLLVIRKDCVTLEGSVCSGLNTLGCWFCPRQIYSYWREAWLRPVETSEQANSPRSSKPAMPHVGDP
jgi:hypothetical protein